MIARDSIFYSRVIENGRLVKQDTFIGAVVKIVGGIVFLGAVFYAVILLGAVIQYTSR
jgi:hypothetical protein